MANVGLRLSGETEAPCALRAPVRETGIQEPHRRQFPFSTFQLPRYRPECAGKYGLELTRSRSAEIVCCTPLVRGYQTAQSPKDLKLLRRCCLDRVHRVRSLQNSQ